jgi:hypothetical protein
MKKLGLFFIVSALAVSAQAQVVITVTDEIPDGANGSGTRSLTTTDGNVSAPATLPTHNLHSYEFRPDQRRGCCERNDCV